MNLPPVTFSFTANTDFEAELNAYVDKYLTDGAFPPLSKEQKAGVGDAIKNQVNMIRDRVSQNEQEGSEVISRELVHLLDNGDNTRIDVRVTVHYQ